MVIKIIGTSHVAQQSLNEIKQAFGDFQPQIVALELDLKRFRALFSNKKPRLRLSDIRRTGFKGFLFALIGSYLQKKIGKTVGITPGSDMLTAAKLAQKHDLPLAFIDQDIEVTLKKFSQSLSWKERLRFFIDLLKGIFTPKRELKKYHLDKLDLTKVPQEKVIQQMTRELKERYPNIYKVLVQERNEIIAQNIHQLQKLHPGKKILVVIGAGHQQEIKRILKEKANKEDKTINS